MHPTAMYRNHLIDNSIDIAESKKRSINPERGYPPKKLPYYLIAL